MRMFLVAVVVLWITLSSESVHIGENCLFVTSHKLLICWLLWT